MRLDAGPGDHVLDRLLVGVALLAVPPVLVGQLPALQRVLLALLESLQLLLRRDVQPELDQDRPLVGEAALEVVDLVVGARPLVLATRTPPPARPGPGRTRCGRRPPSRPSPGSDGQNRQRKWWRFSSWVGAANWTTRTCRGSSGATSRLIAPPLPEASQPSKATQTGGPSSPPPIRPPSVSRSWVRRVQAALQPLGLLLLGELLESDRARPGRPCSEPRRCPAVVRGDRELEQPDRSQDHHDPEGDDPVALAPWPYQPTRNPIASSTA